MEAVEPSVETAMAAYRRCWSALRQTAEPAWAQLSLTASQLKCLLLLDIRQSMTIGQLADILMMSRSSASITIDQLVQLGLVARSEDPSDRRRTLVCPTPEGFELSARLHQGDEEFMRIWFERMRHKDLEALTSGLEAFARVVELTLS